MGLNVHVVKRFEDYGDTCAFNWRFESFSDLLTMLCGDYAFLSEDGTCYEYEKAKYKKGLSFLKKYRANPKKKNVRDFIDNLGIDEDDMNETIEVLGGMDRVIKVMDSFLKECDKKSDYIRFVAW